MPKELEDLSSAAIATERFNDVLRRLQAQGLTQTQIAAKAGIAPQYLSDIKRGKRPVTELIARRLGDEFDFNYRWLLGISDTMEIMKKPSTTGTADSTVSLPLLPCPIEGEPRQNQYWKGVCVEVSGFAAGRIGLARYPYVLQFGHDDHQGRLKKNDLILISQAPNPKAEIQVVHSGKKYFLARANPDGSWIRLERGKTLISDCPATGHCLGIVWAPLV